MVTMIRDWLWAVMVGGAFGLSVGTLIVVCKLSKRILRCEETQDYLAGREVERLLGAWLSDGDGLSAGSARVDDGSRTDADGPLTDGDGPAAGG